MASLPASAESTVDISAVEGAEFVKDKEIVAASQLEAAILAQSKGFDKEPTEFSVVQIEESTVTLANGTVLLGVETDGRGHTSIEFIPEPEVRRPTALSEASAIDIVSSTGMQLRNGGCTTISNSTGWMNTCYQRFQSNNKVHYNSKSQYLNVLTVEATHKSQGVWTMKKARIRATPNQGGLSQVKRVPAADSKVANCQSYNMSVTVGAIGVGASTERCDKWDVGWSANGQMDNTWFGNSWRSERLVSMMVGVAHPSTTDVTWALKSDFWAQV